MKIHTAEHLFDKNQDKFICPECDEILKLRILPSSGSSDSIVDGFCVNCREEIYIDSPDIIKKLIYVDSWFISALFDSDSGMTRERFGSILDKLRELDRLQKIQIVVSNIHAQEIARIPVEYNPAQLWGSIVNLASGYVTNYTTDVQVSQYRKSISNLKDTFHWQDIFDRNPHDWNPGIKIILNKIWMLSLLNKFDPGYKNINDECRRLLKNQIHDTCRNGDSPQECFEYINQLTREDTSKGIDYRIRSIAFHEQIENWIENKGTLENIPTGAEELLVHPGREIYSALIQDIVGHCEAANEEMNKLQELGGFLISNSNLPKSVLISNAFEGYRLHKAIQATQQAGVTENDRKFSKKYGVSAVNDTNHISTFAPYVDAMLVDNGAQRIIESDLLQDQLADVECKFYSSINLDDFEKCLDELLDEPESRDCCLTRRLLVGPTEKELNEQIKLEVTNMLNDYKQKLKIKLQSGHE